MAKKDKLGGLDVYQDGDEDEHNDDSNPLKKLWNSTVFPEKLKSMKEEKQFQRQLRKEAKEQAQEEIRAQLIEQYKQEEIDKATGKQKKSNFGEKLMKGIMGEPGSKNKFADALGGGNTGGSIGSSNKLNAMLGNTGSNDKTATNTRLRHLLGDSQRDIMNDDDIEYYIADKKVQKKKAKKKRSRKVEVVYPKKDDKIDKILGKDFNKKSDDFEEKMRRMMG